ncbi:hypothetical protein [Plantibacter sp. YIM 135347]|uniref:hypothetical protein n=1 Tax=Plantibacter sp. YIM 135347 TaxID=3423919 RepID=UPI003D327C0D
MDPNTPTPLTITRTSSADPDAIARDVVPEDVDLSVLHAVIVGYDANMKLTEKALNDEALKELAESVRAAHTNLQDIAIHLTAMHTRIYKGHLNYPEHPQNVSNPE